MSWLFVGLVPALLMVVTIGLERLEAGLNRGAVQPGDVAEFLERAEPGDVSMLARTGMPEALDGFHRRRTQRMDPVRADARHAHPSRSVRAQLMVNP